MTYNILFLCTGNSARSILAEAITNHLSKNLRAYSAGSYPKGAVNPHALEFLVSQQISVAGLRSKSWDEFTHSNAPQFDFIITVCDQAAGEQCPLWPGQPVTAHWGMPDPAAVMGDAETIRRAFAETARVLKWRIELFASLPVDKLDHLSLREQITAIGKRNEIDKS